MKSTITLLTNSVLQVPLFNYEKDFTFIINNEEFQTNKFFADLLSPKISKMHVIDPTLNKYLLNTKVKGDFKHFLDLLDFKSKEIDEKEFEFISEIIEELSIEYIDIDLPKIEINKENIFQLILSHSRFSYFYSNQLEQEINFLSEHLYELKEKEELLLLKKF